MTVAFDALSSATNPAPSFTHTPVGTPRGVLLFVTALTGTDTVTGATLPTYGGVVMTEVTGSPLLKATGETLACHAFFLGSGIPTGAQTVSLVDTPAGDEIAICVTVTADADMEIVAANTSINSDSDDDPASTLGLLGRTCFVAMGFGSGQNATTSVTPFSGWTSRAEAGNGVKVGGCYTYDTVGSTDVTVGWTQTAEDALAIAVAIAEVAGGLGIPIAAYHYNHHLGSMAS